MEGLFKLSWANVKSAIVYGLLTFLAAFILSIVQQVLDAGTFLGLNWVHIIDSSAVSTLPLMIVGLSIIKNLLTNSKGEFLGITNVIADNVR